MKPILPTLKERNSFSTQLFPRLLRYEGKAAAEQVPQNLAKQVRSGAPKIKERGDTN